MIAHLAAMFDPKHIDPSDAESFFDKAELDVIDSTTRNRECSDHQTFPPPCDVNLFFGLFFDGTNNNLERDKKTHIQSNVARLYQAFPGSRDAHGSEAWPDSGTKYKNFFRTYIPGVGTEFREVGDSGVGSMRTKGLAFAYMAENRIIWALVQTINHIHAYYTNDKLISKDEFLKTFNKLELSPSVDPTQKLTDAFTKVLKDLHQKLEVYLPVGDRKKKDHGVVRNIYISMFGFSRGATEARAFANWFVWLCGLEASLGGKTGLTLGTIPVTFDFMGLFDTVASVGLANSVPLLPVDGHSAWADCEKSLRIRESGIGPTQCLHLVSAHEIRRSFPLDSVMYKGVMPSNCKEVVFPGVHSDVGGGYAPKEQGRGIDDAKGADLLSRITLATMYRTARLAGVPIKLEDAPEPVKESFKVGPGVIQAFNAYIQACPEVALSENAPVTGPLHELMAQQHQLYIQWRKQMRGKNMINLSSFKASDIHDKTDIEKANEEFEREIHDFEEWRDYQGDDFNRPYSRPEWVVIKDYWKALAPSPSITDLFERYVHDSRAWFKPFGKDIPDLQLAMERLAKRQEDIIEYQIHPYGDPNTDAPLSLTKTEAMQLKLYIESGHTRQGLTPEKKGRENAFMGGGFLRYRKIYMGNDSFKPAGAVYAGLAPKHDINKQHVAARRQANQKKSA